MNPRKVQNNEVLFLCFCYAVIILKKNQKNSWQNLSIKYNYNIEVAYMDMIKNENQLIGAMEQLYQDYLKLT